MRGGIRVSPDHTVGSAPIPPFDSFFAFNHLNYYAGVTKALKENNVDMAGLWGFGLGQGRCEILLAPKNADAFKPAAKLGWKTKELVCFRVTGEDRVGALVDDLEKIAAYRAAPRSTCAPASLGSCAIALS